MRVFVKAALKMGYDVKVFDAYIIDRNVYLSFSENYRLIYKRKNEKIEQDVQKGELKQEDANK